jgi:GntR family transcriptional regulator
MALVARLPSSDARLPLYRRVRDSLAAEIVSGVWRPGLAIPPEDALAEDFGVAVGTIRKALEGLVADGWLVRQQGRGTFVRRADFGNAMFRFFRHTDASGAPLHPTARLLSRRLDVADAKTAGRLGITEGDATIALFRLRLVAERPLLAEEIVVSAVRFSALLEIDQAAFGDLLYPLYESACGEIVARAAEYLRFGSASAAIAVALGVQPGAGVAIIDRTAYAYDDAPLEFRRSYGPADRFSYTLEIK